MRRLNKKGETEEKLIQVNVVYLVLLLLFIGGISAFIWQQSNAAGIWEDYYAKELAKTVNYARAGDKFSLNVHEATRVASKNGLDLENIFEFDNENKEVCVKLNLERKTCYSYFNRVLIVDDEVELAKGKEASFNVLKFKVIKDSLKEIENEE